MLYVLDAIQGTGDLNTTASGSGPFTRLATMLGGWLPAIADLFLVIAVLVLIGCFGMITIEGPQKVQQSKSHLIRIMFGAAGIMAASWLVGFFAHSGQTGVGSNYGGGYSAGTVMPSAKFALAKVFPSLF